MKDISEMIKDAQAEEEQEKNTKFGNALKEQLKDVLKEGGDSKVSISLDEYLVLKALEMDLDRVLSSIIEALTLSYNNEYLVIRESEGIVNAIKVLYPEVYDKVYEEEIDNYTKEIDKYTNGNEEGE